MYMLHEDPQQHPMKMVWGACANLQGRFFRRHEHGMDHGRNLDELPRAFNPPIPVER
jgi:hypothetical protein